MPVRRRHHDDAAFLIQRFVTQMRMGRWGEAAHDPDRKTCFEDVIRCPLLERLYREFFAHTPGHEDERHLRASLLRNSQCGNAIETGKSVVRQNQLNSALLKESEEVGLGFGTG